MKLGLQGQVHIRTHFIARAHNEGLLCAGNGIESRAQARSNSAMRNAESGGKTGLPSDSHSRLALAS